MKKMKKGLTVAGLSIAIAASSVGCKSNTEVLDTEIQTEFEVEDTELNENIEEIIDEEIIEEESTEAEAIEYPDWSLEELIAEIDKSEFDKSTKEILKAIVSNNDEYHVQYNATMALIETNKDKQNEYICSVLVYAINKQDSNYKLDDLKIVDNRDGSSENLPQNISLLEHINTYSNYKFYSIKSVLYKSEFIVTDLNDNVIASTITFMRDSVKNYNAIPPQCYDIYGYRVIEDEKIQLSSFEDLLKEIGMSNEIKDEYGYDGLIIDLSSKVSKKLSDNKKAELRKENLAIFSKDELDAINGDDEQVNDYYILQKDCPYIFDDEVYIYRDVYNDDAIVISINNSTGIIYEDYKQEIELYKDYSLWGYIDEKNICPKSMTIYLHENGLDDLMPNSVVTQEELDSFYEYINNAKTYTR